ncbi:DotA/TraY family protein [Candidatus Methylospira mobilis]|uniref:DotA/TraY family protein n=1 Tax=Candidatus Methylospira mobilis TaxID=1808979 RepID=UPI0028EDE1DF|nr:DotA/TraY family protein [Candidatus Methylospira mobilis]WNV05902.1 DotA/TraY family protein [Candidatus Methylospira mobilis]
MDPTTALNFVPAADVSYNALNSLIGAGWDTILTGGNPTGAGGVLLSIMAAFNAVGIAVAAIMVFYQIHAGVIDTAHQGEALGKSRSTLWVPLRIAGGIAMMMPLPWCQASLLQALILKFVFLSIAGADFINTQVTNQITANGGHITTPVLMTGKIDEVTTSLLSALAIQEYYKYEMPSRGSDDLIVSKSSDGTFYRLGLASPDPDVSNDYLGYIKVPCVNGTNDPVCKARVDAITAMVPTLRTIATTFTDCYSCPSVTAQPGWMIGAMNQYQSSVQSALMSWIQSQQPTEDSDISQFAQVAQNQGWASIGSWYWTLMHFNEAASDEATSEAVVGSYPDTAFFGKKGYSNIVTTYANTGHYLKKVSNIVDISGTSSVAAPSSGATGWLSQFFPTTLFGNIGAKLVNALSTGDPVSNAQALGQGMIAGAEVGTIAAATAYGAVKGAEGAADGAKSSLLGIIGIGVLTKAPAGFAVGVADFMKETIHELLSASFFIGLCLAYYLPAIPFITWSLGFIGWMILIMEAVFAAPVWATAHALPDGDGFIGQSARRGYMLLLNILLRPSLMTTGFYISFLMMPVVGTFIGSGYQVFISGLMNASPQTGLAMNAAPALFGAAGLTIGGIISGLAVVTVGGILLAMAEHQVFSIITWLPENIMRWIEGQMGGMGEHERENKIQGLVMAKFGRSEAVSRATRRGPRRTPGGGGKFTGG